MDIREFNALESGEIPKELFNLDILDGSPPCTTFSTAGEREKNWGKAKKFREGQKEQTLDDLSFIFIETAKKLKPKVVVMENVEGLLIGNAWCLSNTAAKKSGVNNIQPVKISDRRRIDGAVSLLNAWVVYVRDFEDRRREYLPPYHK